MTREQRPRSFDPDNRERLAAFLQRQLGASRVVIEAAQLLTGGAICENWRLAVTVEGGTLAGRHDWVMRMDGAARMAMSHDRGDEFAIISAAHAAGVRVAQPIALSRDGGDLGKPFMVVGRLDGMAEARKLVRDPALPRYGDALAEELGRQLGRLHRLTPGAHGLACLPLPTRAAGRQMVATLQGYLDGVSEPRPALEHVLQWLDRNAPDAAGLVLCHGDFRTGNYMVHDDSLTGILDWEFAHWGDRHEDLGWFTARCWRFGAVAREAGGIGSRGAFYRGYESVAPGAIDRPAMAYWEILAAARWAVVALLQGERHITGGETSIELTLTGLMAPEMEYEALRGIAALEAANQGTHDHGT